MVLHAIAINWMRLQTGHYPACYKQHTVTHCFKKMMSCCPSSPFRRRDHIHILQKGFPRNTLLAAALDPRSKSLKGIGADDKKKIWGEISGLMHKVIGEQKKGADDAIYSNHATVAPKGFQQPMVDLFNGIGDDDDAAPDDASTDEHKIYTELEYYKNLKGLSVMLQGNVLSDPLAWWQVQEKTLPLLSILARRMLCVPATSAPTERVFSVAGLTLSKNRASTLPQHASDLIFLHDSWLVAEECEAESRLNK